MLHETSIATSSLSCIHQSRRPSCSQVTQLAHIIKARAFSTLRMPRAKIFTRRDCLKAAEDPKLNNKLSDAYYEIIR